MVIRKAVAKSEVGSFNSELGPGRGERSSSDLVPARYLREIDNSLANYERVSERR